MHPILFDFGTHDLPLLGVTHLFIPTYGVLFATGALLAWAWFVRRAKALGLPQEPIFNLAFYTLIGGLIGAKVTLVIIDLPYYLAHPAQILATIRSAGVLMGGVLAGALTFILCARRAGLPLFALGDAIAAPLALAQGIGRLGCFAAGCCWGVASDAWCAVRFTDPAAHEQTGVPQGVSLLPVQLIECLFDLLLAVLLTVLWRKKPQPPGTVFWVYLGLYGLGRAILEHFRGDEVRGLWLGGAVSTSQIFSLAAIVIAAAFLVRGRARRVARA